MAGDDSDIPRNLHNIVVSIHAIATFQALHDYLRPRVAGLLSGGSRLSGMFAALAASGLVGSTTTKSPGEEPSSSSKPDQVSESSTTPGASSTPTVQRRRSQRLAQLGTTSSEESPGGGDHTTAPSAPTAHDGPAPAPSDSSPNPVAAEKTPSDTLVDSELHADFSDEDEIDAEVFDEDGDPENPVAEKTITLSVAEGMF